MARNTSSTCEQVEVCFVPIGSIAVEDYQAANLALADGRLVAVLSYVVSEEEGNEQGWYLEAGFGPCEGEAKLFETLDGAAAWVRAQVQRPDTGWLLAGGHERERFASCTREWAA